eukprot:TRINITY_DN31563_c0_g1_i1.p1 TRINITY_DN31563_c0_g1~~TRINITY_DN31563_c0_g1_i1.p1  ORF type:complete len:924 (+),score=149.99 TRINITY_DN31563_c0_g1_i1:70-2841(+)
MCFQSAGSGMHSSRRRGSHRRTWLVALAVVGAAVLGSATQLLRALSFARFWRPGAAADRRTGGDCLTAGGLHRGARGRAEVRQAAARFNRVWKKDSNRTGTIRHLERQARDAPLQQSHLAAYQTGIQSSVDSAEEEESGYVIDEGAIALPAPQSIGEVKYFGVSEVEGVAIDQEPGGEEVDRLMPGDVVAAETPSAGGHARLLDGRGWLDLNLLGAGLEEVQPWAARLMKPAGITKADAASLAYVSLDDSNMPPLGEHLPLPSRVLAELDRRGISKASPIQEAVFSDIHKGKSLCLQSQTGTGKTLAMMLPLLTAMSEESQWGKNGDKIIVVTSARELAAQLYSDIDSMRFYPQGKGFATLVCVGNVPPTEAILNANIIIGTPNELGGVLHKDNDLIRSTVTQLRAIVLDEVDSYTTAPKIFASKWKIKRKRRLYNEKKAVLDGKLGDFNTGLIEWFLKRSLAYNRRQDLQVLAASATMNRNMAYKVHRLLRWDPLGRWYNKPPPLMRPKAAMRADWQAIPMMPTIPLEVKHRYVPVTLAKTNTRIADRHWTRKPVDKGGLARIKIKRTKTGRGKNLHGEGGRPVAKGTAACMMDGLYDALRSRKPGSSMVIICRTAGVTVRDTVRQLHAWGIREAEAIHAALWDDPEDWPSRWAIKYSHDMQDHAPQIAARHRELNERTRQGRHVAYPVGSDAWTALERRKKAGETTSPILVGFEGAGRGLHFDGIETVYILGILRTPQAYLHLAGRVGRLGQPAGKVISVLPVKAKKVLDSWRKLIGPGVQIEREPINRFRSAHVSETEAYEKPLVQRRLKLSPPSKVDGQKLGDGKEEAEPLLLPKPKDYVQLPGFDDDFFEKKKQPEFVEANRVAQAIRYGRRGPDINRITDQVQRATNRWAQPRKVPKHQTKYERIQLEKEKQRIRNS